MTNVDSGSCSKRSETRRIRDLPISKAQHDCFSFISKLLIRKVEDKNMKTWVGELNNIRDIGKHCSIIKLANINEKVSRIDLYRERN